jgi:hypothetical protein
VRPKSALLTHRVEEASAHVQGESLKADADLLDEALSTPRSPGRGLIAMDQKTKSYIGAFAFIIFVWFGFWILNDTGTPQKSTPASPPASDAGSKAWVADQLDPTHVIEKAQLQQCMQTPGCDPTGLAAVPTPAPDTSQGDPYANGQRQVMSADYLRSRAMLLADAKLVYFAAGCRVIQDADANLTVIDGTNALQQNALNDRITFDPDLANLIPDAERAGVAQAKEEGCHYWQQNPEAVRVIRLKVQLAESGP